MEIDTHALVARQSVEIGLTRDLRPRFVRRYADLAGAIRDAASAYAKDVREGKFPSEEESFSGSSKPALRRVY